MTILNFKMLLFILNFLRTHVGLQLFTLLLHCPQLFFSL